MHHCSYVNICEVVTNGCRVSLGFRNEPERTRLEKLPCREISGWGKSLHASPVFASILLCIALEVSLGMLSNAPKYGGPSGETDEMRTLPGAVLRLICISPIRQVPWNWKRWGNHATRC